MSILANKKGSENMIVETMQGPIQGIEVNGHIEFRGIPYAKAPIGELRWKPPVAPLKHDDVYMADTFQCRAIQSLKNINKFYQKEFSYPQIPYLYLCLLASLMVFV